MSEMIERVARAIGGPWFDGDPESVVSNFPGQTEQYREKFRQQARAAIEAMREPPEHYKKIVYHGDYGDDVWRDMIDEMLK